ncbi:MAG: ABC transporter substrate-binding protein [Dehalococcoidia bacterium]|nr:ABC transporter substrate-binding protein [Dehalococcoidia bacterium]
MNKSRWAMGLVSLAVALVFLLTACAPAATPTPTPIKAAPTATAAPKPAATAAPAPAATPTTAAPKPAATPTTAAPKPASGTPIKIGFVNPLSGALASFGVLQRIAVNLAVEDINAAGGINGAPIQLLIEDSPFDPKQAVTVVRKLAETDKVFAIVGPYATGEFEVAAPLANELKLTVVSPSAMKVGVAGRNRPYSFQMNLRDDVANPIAIDAYKKKFPNVKRVVLTGDTKEAVTEAMVKDIFPRLLKEKGLEIIETVTFETGMTDFSAVVTKIKGLNPDGVVLAAIMPPGITFAKEYERQGVKAPVLTSAHVIGGPFVQNAGTSVEGWIMAGLFNWENPDPKIQSFVKRFFERAGADPAVKPPPAHISTEGIYYDTVSIIAEIMRKAGIKPDSPLQEARDKIRDGMISLKDYQGLSGKITIDPSSGEATREGMPAITSQNGKWAVVK